LGDIYTVKYSFFTPLVAFILLLSLSSASLAAPPKLDADGDGFSNPMFVEPAEEGEATIINHIKRYDGGEHWFDVAQFGDHTDGDMNVPADYTGDGRTNMAVVSINNNNRFVWRVQNDDGSVTQRVFGREGQTVLSGCDFRGDGRADLAVIRGRTLRYRSLEGDDPVGVYRIRGGRHIDYTCGDLTGDFRDELVTISIPGAPAHRVGGNVINVHDSSGEWISRRVRFAGRRRPKAITADVENIGTERPGFFRRLGAVSRAIFLTPDGVEIFDLPRFNIPNGHITSGMYEGDNSQAFPGLIVQAMHDDLFYQKNLLTREERQIDTSGINAEGDLFLSKAVNTYETKKAAPKPAPGGGGGGQCGVSSLKGGIACHQCRPSVSIPKSESDGRLVVLFHNKYNGKISSVQVVRKSNCEVLATGNPAGLHNPWGNTGLRSHWRFTQPGGNYGLGVMIRMNRHNATPLGYDLPNPGIRYEWDD